MRRKIPSLQALACLEAAARHESYTRAAQELAMTQSAVSRQITSLEEFLGVALFRRTRHGVALTVRGAQYAAQVAPRLEALELTTLDVMSAQGSGGSVHLAAVPTFATRWLIPRLPQLAALHPEITVHIETRTRPFLFADTGFDAALHAGTKEQLANWPGTRSMRLFDEEMVPVGSPQLLGGRRALSPESLAQLPLLHQSTRPNAWRQWLDTLGVAAPRALAGPRYELFSMTAAAAAQGLGLALLPRLLIEAELSRGDLVLACERLVPSDLAYYVVIPDHADERPIVATFLNWLHATAASAPELTSISFGGSAL
jgi:LysR family glycine cleavage system transcriptional activator